MTGPILLQGAMDVETDRTAERLEDRREETIGGFRQAILQACSRLRLETIPLAAG